jgi:hypothetical protein
VTLAEMNRECERLDRQLVTLWSRYFRMLRELAVRRRSPLWGWRR